MKPEQEEKLYRFIEQKIKNCKKWRGHTHYNDSYEQRQCEPITESFPIHVQFYSFLKNGETEREYWVMLCYEEKDSPQTSRNMRTNVIPQLNKKLEPLVIKAFAKYEKQLEADGLESANATLNLILQNITLERKNG